MRVAVTVNDMSEVNIDSAFVRDGRSSLSRGRRAVVRDEQRVHRLPPIEVEIEEDESTEVRQ